MQYLGKILGCFIGYRLTGSFLGAILGFIIGNWLDHKFYANGKISSRIFGKKLTRESLFMLTTFAVMGHMAKSKGRVTQADITLANAFMQRLRLNAEQQQLAQEAFTLGKSADFPLSQAIQEFREACGKRSDLLRFFVEVQMQTALQDGELDPKEQEMLFNIAQIIGMSQFQFQQMLAMAMASARFRAGFDAFQQGAYHEQYQSQGSYQPRSSNTPRIDDAYNLLGVSANDDQTTVKRAYRKLMNEHHPDKLASKGLPEEMLELAKEKSQQIQAAYDLICKQKGWK